MIVKANSRPGPIWRLLLFQSSSEGNSTLLLIDGGTSQTYESDLKPTLEAFPKEERKLDLVALSHIDNDHVLGLLDLFKDIKKSRDSKKAEIIKIESLWHNSFSDIVGEQRQNGLLINEQFFSRQFSAVSLDSNKIHAPVIGALKGVSEGGDLRKLAQSLHIPINRQYGGDLIVARDENKTIKIGNINFSILGPTQKNLDKLRILWNDWLRKHDKPLDTAGDFRALQALDASIANLSSIMFIAESQGKKILFTGDGLGDDAVDMLSERKLLDSEGGYHVDLLKVPHHGSERNASPEFFNTVTADTYVISANGRDDNPSLSTLKWIIENKRKKDKTIKIFLTNRIVNTDKILQTYDEEKFQYRFTFLSKESHSVETS